MYTSHQYMVRLGLLLIDIAFIIDGCPKKDREDREARENRRAREAREGGPPVKEDPMGEREGEKEGEKEEKGSAVGEMWRLLLSRRVLLDKEEGSPCSESQGGFSCQGGSPEMDLKWI